MYYSNKDSANFSRFIDTSMGLYIMYGTESGNRFAWYKTLGFSQSFWENHFTHVPIRLKVMNDSLKSYKLRYSSSLPEYDEEKWDKEGLFVDTTKSDHILSDVAKFVVKYEGADFSKKELNTIKKIENSSRRIVLANNNYRVVEDINYCDDFVFYLMYKNYRWYITIIDFATSW